MTPILSLMTNFIFPNLSKPSHSHKFQISSKFILSNSLSSLRKKSRIEASSLFVSLLLVGFDHQGIWDLPIIFHLLGPKMSPFSIQFYQKWLGFHQILWVIFVMIQLIDPNLMMNDLILLHIFQLISYADMHYSWFWIWIYDRYTFIEKLWTYEWWFIKAIYDLWKECFIKLQLFLR